MITRKERTSREIGEWLVGEGASESLVADVLARLEELQLLDDEKFAFLYAEDKRERSGWGADRIQQALLDRGIEYGLADSAASVAAEDEEDRAVGSLAEKSYDLEDPSERQKALGFLARRGYGAEVAYSAIRRARRGPKGAVGRHLSGASDRPSGAAPSR